LALFFEGPIASTFWQNEEYATGLADIVLDGVVCVVDAVFGQQVCIHVSKNQILILIFSFPLHSKCKKTTQRTICKSEKAYGKSPRSPWTNSFCIPFSRQIAAADVILLNKVDVADPLVVSETEALIRHINPAAPIHRTIKGEIDLKHIIGISAYKNPPCRIILQVMQRQSCSKQDDHVHTADCNTMTKKTTR
jgi:G3E family GTPase